MMKWIRKRGMPLAELREQAASTERAYLAAQETVTAAEQALNGDGTDGAHKTLVKAKETAQYLKDQLANAKRLRDETEKTRAWLQAGREVVRETLDRVQWATLAAIGAGKRSWECSARDYVPEYELQERKRSREHEEAMRTLAAMELRKGLRGPFAPKDVWPEA